MRNTTHTILGLIRPSIMKILLNILNLNRITRNLRSTIRMKLRTHPIINHLNTTPSIIYLNNRTNRNNLLLNKSISRKNTISTSSTNLNRTHLPRGLQTLLCTIRGQSSLKHTRHLSTLLLRRNRNLTTLNNHLYQISSKTGKKCLINNMTITMRHTLRNIRLNSINTQIKSYQLTYKHNIIINRKSSSN